MNHPLPLVLQEQEQQQVLAQMTGEQEIRAHVLASVRTQPLRLPVGITNVTASMECAAAPPALRCG
jgi:hypothetical protein